MINQAIFLCVCLFLTIFTSWILFNTQLMWNINSPVFTAATVKDLPLSALFTYFWKLLRVTCFHPVSVLKWPTTCIHAAIEWLKSSVQIQMSNLFVFVWREPFLSGTARSICETQSEELFICLGCSPALLVQLSQPPAVICVSTLCCDGQLEASHSRTNA